MMSQFCSVCGRRVQDSHTPTRTHRPIMSVRYVHAGYGCDTGCCGHEFYGTYDLGGTVTVGNFEFCHDKDELDSMVAALADHLKCSIGECEFVDD